MKQSFNVVMVLYGGTIADSVALRNLKLTMNNYDIVVYIADNGGSDSLNEAYINSESIEYLCMSENKGLSKAYNTVLDMMRPCDIVVFLDEDTEISPDYFSLLEQRSSVSNAEIFAPIILGQDERNYSPNSAGLFKNRQFINSPDEICQEDFNAIMSCLAVRYSLFENYRFNESLFVDQIDQNFFDQFRGKIPMECLQVVLKQNFHQRGSNIPPSKGLARLKCRLVDLAIYYRMKKNATILIAGFFKGCILSIQMASKCKSWKVACQGIGIAFLSFFIKEEEH